MKRILIVMAAAVISLFAASCAREKAPVAVSSDVSYSELDGKGVGWGFVKKEGAPPDMPAKLTGTLEKYGGGWLDASGDKSLYLTFDEGYENGFTAVILDILKKTGTPAAFFVTGQYLEGQGELIKRMIDEGHIVGNHTMRHLNLPKQSVETVKTEITELNDKCTELYGYKMEYMRPPEGEYSERTLAITRGLGMKTIMWSFAYKDWDVNIQKGADYAYRSVMPYLHNGAVILLHAVSSDNTSALEKIITDAKAEGYEFRSLDELPLK